MGYDYHWSTTSNRIRLRVIRVYLPWRIGFCYMSEWGVWKHGLDIGPWRVLFGRQTPKRRPAGYYN